MKTVWILFERLVLLATMIGIIIGVIAYMEEKEARTEARRVNLETLKSIEEQRRINAATLEEFKAASEERASSMLLMAWEILTRVQASSAGKDWALSYLNKIGEDLVGVNVSCESMIPQEAPICGFLLSLKDIDLRGARLDMSNFSGILMERINFTDARLFNANFSHTVFTDVDFTNADLKNANFQNANLEGDFSHAHISWARFEDAWLSPNAQETLRESWAWSNELPKGLSGYQILSCEPVYNYSSDIQIVDKDMKNRTTCAPITLE